MRRLAATGTLVALVLAGPAALAKPGHGPSDDELMPTVAGPPAGISAGTPWNARIVFGGGVSFDGPIRAYLRITERTNGTTKLFSAPHAGGGSFVARVVFPSAGDWALEVLLPGGPSWPAGTTSVGHAAQAAASGGFRLAATAGGAIAALAIAALAVAPRLRRSKPEPALG